MSEDEQASTSIYQVNLTLNVYTSTACTMDFYPAAGFSGSSLKGSTLIVVCSQLRGRKQAKHQPSVSLANLPQLAVDLIISSLGLQRVGCIGDGSTTVPFVGSGENGEVVTGGLELYGLPGGEVYAIQQRSPPIKTEKDAHVALLKSFITSHQFGFVLLLTSLDAANQDDAQLQTPLQRINPPSSSSIGSTPSHPALARLADLPPLQLHIASPLSAQPLNAPPGGGLYPPFLPGGGLARRLLVSFKDSNVVHAGVSAWCVEGDNRDDARALAAATLHVVGTGTSCLLAPESGSREVWLRTDGKVELREPKSWKSLFGSSEGWSGGLGSNAEIYG